MYDGLREIPRRYPAIDVGPVHLGGTALPGLMVTMDDVQGAGWAELSACRRVVPIHYDDYTVFRSPLSDFEKKVRERGLSDRVHVVPRGGTFAL